jgi:hypothetical protein
MAPIKKNAKVKQINSEQCLRLLLTTSIWEKELWQDLIECL